MFALIILRTVAFLVGIYESLQHTFCVSAFINLTYTHMWQYAPFETITVSSNLDCITLLSVCCWLFSFFLSPSLSCLICFLFQMVIFFSLTYSVPTMQFCLANVSQLGALACMHVSRHASLFAKLNVSFWSDDK